MATAIRTTSIENSGSAALRKWTQQVFSRNPTLHPTFAESTQDQRRKPLIFFEISSQYQMFLLEEYVDVLTLPISYQGDVQQADQKRQGALNKQIHMAPILQQKNKA